MSHVTRHRTPFDHVAASYDATIPSHVREHYLRRRTALVASYAQSGRVLDVGCGTGTFMAALATTGTRALGVDDSFAMLQQRLETRRGRVIQALAHQLPLRDATVDAAVTVATLHHLVDREIVARSIREMVRVTRSGGVVILWDHNPLNPYWPIFMRRLPQDAGGYRLVPLRDVLRVARSIEAVTRIQVIRSGAVPDFTPRPLLPFMARVERCWEATPFLRNFLAHNVVILHVRHPH